MSDAANTDDIDLVIRGPVDDQLEENAEEIAKLKAMVEDVLPEEWDDIWLLRFILSNKGTAKDAVEKCKFTIQWRKDNKETLDMIAAGGEIPHKDLFNKYQVAGPHKCDKDGAPCFIVRIGLSNPSALMDAATHDQVVEFLLFSREKDFLTCDRITREKRRIVKCISIQDMRGMKLLSDRRFFKALGASSKLSEKLYPQLLGTSVPINIPSFFKFIMKFATAFMSKKSLAKMKPCPGDTNGDITKCPFVMSKFNIEDIPTFLGGKCSCPGGGCINGVPNSQTVMNSNVNAEGEITLSVKSRSKQSCDMGVVEGSKVKYTFSVKSKNIVIDAKLRIMSDNNVEGEDSGNDDIILLPQQTVSVKDGKLEGDWDIPADGILDFTFDNSSSLLSSKSVTYSMVMVNPDPVLI